VILRALRSPLGPAALDGGQPRPRLRALQSRAHVPLLLGEREGPGGERPRPPRSAHLRRWHGAGRSPRRESEVGLGSSGRDAVRRSRRRSRGPVDQEERGDRGCLCRAREDRSQGQQHLQPEELSEPRGRSWLPTLRLFIRPLTQTPPLPTAVLPNRRHVESPFRPSVCVAREFYRNRIVATFCPQIYQPYFLRNIRERRGNQVHSST
jgi:hypothetical protein